MLKRWLAKLCSFNVTRRKPQKRFVQKDGSLPDSHDERDQQYAISGILPDFKTRGGIREFVSEVKHQGNANSCVAHAAALLFETELRIHGVEFDASEAQLYYDARELGRLLPKDIGSYPRDVLKVMHKKGISPEKLCPYDPADINRAPDKFSRSFQGFFKIKSYHLVSSIDDIKQELDNFHGAMINIPIYDNVREATGGWIGHPGNARPNGQHEVLIIEHDEEFQNPDGTKGAFLIQNSWGRGWGRNGQAWISYDFFLKEHPFLNGDMRAYTIRVTA